MTTADWIKLALVGLGYLVTLAVMWTKMGARVDSAEENLERHAKYIGEHYKSLSALDKNMEGLERELASHITEDRKEFMEVKGLLTEQRGDIKDILKHLRNGTSE